MHDRCDRCEGVTRLLLSVECVVLNDGLLICRGLNQVAGRFVGPLRGSSRVCLNLVVIFCTVFRGP